MGDGQESWNVFANNWSNHVPAAQGADVLALSAKFATATPNIQQVGLSDFSRYGQDGVLIPDDLSPIPEGSTLWHVYAVSAPEELGGQEELIGDLILRSPLVTSLWGDTHLFFRHQDMREDFVLHPEWDQYTDKFGGGLIPTEC